MVEANVLRQRLLDRYTIQELVEVIGHKIDLEDFISDNWEIIREYEDELDV